MTRRVPPARGLVLFFGLCNVATAADENEIQRMTAIVLLLFGVGAAVILILLLLWYHRRKTEKQKDEKAKKKNAASSDVEKAKETQLTDPQPEKTAQQATDSCVNENRSKTEEVSAQELVQPSAIVSNAARNPEEFALLDPLFKTVAHWEWQQFFKDYQRIVDEAKKPFPIKVDPESCPFYEVRSVIVCQFPRRMGLDGFLSRLIERRPTHILMLNNEKEGDMIYYPMSEGSQSSYPLDNKMFIRFTCTKFWKEDEIEYRELEVVTYYVLTPDNHQVSKMLHIKAVSILEGIRTRYGSLLAELEEQRENFKAMNILASEEMGPIVIHCENGYEYSPMVALALNLMRCVLAGQTVDPYQLGREIHLTIPGALCYPKDFLLSLYFGLYCLAYRINPEVADFDHMNNTHNFEIEFLEANHRGNEFVISELRRFGMEDPATVVQRTGYAAAEAKASKKTDMLRTMSVDRRSKISAEKKSMKKSLNNQPSSNQPPPSFNTSRHSLPKPVQRRTLSADMRKIFEEQAKPREKSALDFARRPPKTKSKHKDAKRKAEERVRQAAPAVQSPPPIIASAKTAKPKAVHPLPPPKVTVPPPPKFRTIPTDPGTSGGDPTTTNNEEEKAASMTKDVTKAASVSKDTKASSTTKDETKEPTTPKVHSQDTSEQTTTVQLVPALPPFLFKK